MKKLLVTLLCIFTLGLVAPYSAEAARPAADLVVQIDQPTTVVVRTADTYTVTVTNQGGRNAQNVEIVIDLPMTNTSPTQHILGDVTNLSNKCQLTDKIVCSMGKVRRNRSKTIRFDLALPTSTAALSVTATVSSTSAESDSNNNVATITPAIQYPDNQITSGPATHSTCTGTSLTAFYECELYPSSISSYSADYAANGTLSFAGQADYQGTWNQNGGNNMLTFSIEQISTSTIVAQFSGYSIGGNCFEGLTTFPNSTGGYVSPTKVCF